MIADQIYHFDLELRIRGQALGNHRLLDTRVLSHLALLEVPTYMPLSQRKHLIFGGLPTPYNQPMI